MKKLLLLPLIAPLFAVTGLADTYNNFMGYSDYWNPLGYPNTATYGETFTAPTDGADLLTSIGFYMGDPLSSGDIVLSAYIATWTGTNAGTLLYSSPSVDYSNTGPTFLDFNNVNTALTPGGSYVAFLSISQYYGSSSGEAYIVPGTLTIPGGNFVYYNNSGDFSALFNSTWDDTGIKPDWAINAVFAPSVPEPATFPVLGALLLAMLALLRRRARPAER